MMTYTKHITQLSADNDWQLDFDITISTPEEAFTPSENGSTLDKIENTTITFIGGQSDGVSETAKLRGTCLNKVWVNTVPHGTYSAVGSIGSGGNITTGETTNQHATLSSYLPLGVDGPYGIYVPHELDGSGHVIFGYSIVLTGDTTYATHTSIDFTTSIPLRQINVHGIAGTEMPVEIKDAIVGGGVAIRTRLIISDAGNIATATIESSDNTIRPKNNLVLTEDDSVETWEINDERYVPNHGFVGQFVSRTLSGKLHNIDDDFNIENKDVEVQIGVVQLGTRYQWLSTEDGEILTDEWGNRIYAKDLGEDSISWYSLGNFLITKPSDDEVRDNTYFEAFDYATKFNADFNASFVNSVFNTSFSDILKSGGSVTAMWLAQYVCAQVGVDFGNSEFTNSSFEIKSNQFVGGDSCRDVMKSIAQLAFGWCRIGWDNKCYIDEPQMLSLLSDDEDVLTNDDYYTLTTQKEIFGPVNRVVVGMSAVDGEAIAVEDVNSIEQYGLTEITIMDNPMLNTSELRSSIVESGRKLFGLYYTPLEMETPGHPWFRGDELIHVVDMDGRTRPTYPFNKTLNYNGHIRTKVTAPAPTKQEKTVAYDRTIYKTLRDVGIRVDKQEGLINIINAKTEATADGLSAIETRFETEITDTYSKTQIQEIISGVAEDGTAVSSVKTTAGTFDKDGLTIEQSGSATKTNLNSNGMIISNTNSALADDELLNVNSDGVDAKNIKVRRYLNIGSHSRLEDYADGTGIFYIGGI